MNTKAEMLHEYAPDYPPVATRNLRRATIGHGQAEPLSLSNFPCTSLRGERQLYSRRNLTAENTFLSPPEKTPAQWLGSLRANWMAELLAELNLTAPPAVTESEKTESQQCETCRFRYRPEDYLVRW